jgi:hypothetical protein
MKRAILLAACVVALCVAAGEARAIQIAVPGLWVDVPIVIGGPGYPPPPLVQPARWPYGPPPPGYGPQASAWRLLRPAAPLGARLRLPAVPALRQGLVG